MAEVEFSVSFEKFEMKVKVVHPDGQPLPRTVTDAHTAASQAFGGLLAAQGRIVAEGQGQTPPPLVVDAITAPPTAAPSNGHTGPTNGQHGNGQTEKPKQTRQRKANAPTAKLRELKAEGFFKQPKSQAEVQDRLRIKGVTGVEPKTLASRLKDLTLKKELFRRDGEEEGSYVYKDTDFDESNGSSNPPEPPPE